MIIVAETPVSIQSNSDRIQFGVLDTDIEVSQIGKLRSPDNFYYSVLDPLTTEFFEGMVLQKKGTVRKVRVLKQLPVTQDFEIDSVQRFFNGISTASIPPKRHDSIPNTIHKRYELLFARK